MLDQFWNTKILPKWTQISKLGTPVASRAVEQLKTKDLRKLGNIKKISNLGGHSLVPSLSSRT